MKINFPVCDFTLKTCGSEEPPANFAFHFANGAIKGYKIRVVAENYVKGRIATGKEQERSLGGGSSTTFIDPCRDTGYKLAASQRELVKRYSQRFDGSSADDFTNRFAAVSRSKSQTFSPERMSPGSPGQSPNVGSVEINEEPHDLEKEAMLEMASRRDCKVPKKRVDVHEFLSRNLAESRIVMGKPAEATGHSNSDSGGEQGGANGGEHDGDEGGAPALMTNKDSDSVPYLFDEGPKHSESFVLEPGIGTTASYFNSQSMDIPSDGGDSPRDFLPQSQRRRNPL